MKKGFTLIEIVVSITLITLIGVTSTILIIKNNNKENPLNKKIYEAANVFIATETDENGNSYEYGITNGAKGIQFTVQNLYDKGYLSDNIVNDLKKETNETDLSKLYILASVSIHTDKENECGSNLILFSNSWDKTKTEPIYLCPYNENNDSGNTIISEIEPIKNGIKLEPIVYDIPDFHISSPSNDLSADYVSIVKDTVENHVYYKYTRSCDYHLDTNWKAISTYYPVKNCTINSRIDIAYQVYEKCEYDENSQSDTAYLLCTDYEFDGSSGKYKLTNCKPSYDVNQLQKKNNKLLQYTCLKKVKKNSTLNTDECDIMYKLKGGAEPDCTYRGKNVGSKPYTFVVDSTVNYEVYDKLKNDTTMYTIRSAIDTDGDSYYIRGNLEKSYVKLKNESNNLSDLFQIIRINGDKSLRLMSTNSIDNLYFPKNGDINTEVPKYTNYWPFTYEKETGTNYWSLTSGSDFPRIYEIINSDMSNMNCLNPVLTFTDSKKRALEYGDLKNSCKGGITHRGYYDGKFSETKLYVLLNSHQTYSMSGVYLPDEPITDEKTVYGYRSSNSTFYSITLKPQINEYTSISDIIIKWYNNNIKDNFENMIVTGKYCLDYKSRYINQTLSKYSDSRLSYDQESIDASLLCTNGEIYESKVGIISADELILAGFVPYISTTCTGSNDADCRNQIGKYNTLLDSQKTNNNNYLNRDKSYYTSTLDYMYDSSSKSIVRPSDIGITNDDYIASRTASIYPVINISNNLKVESGTGTKDDPYILVKNN